MRVSNIEGIVILQEKTCNSIINVFRMLHIVQFCYATWNKPVLMSTTQEAPIASLDPSTLLDLLY